jgi:hypothetical protein
MPEWVFFRQIESAIHQRLISASGKRGARAADGINCLNLAVVGIGHI